MFSTIRSGCLSLLVLTALSPAAYGEGTVAPTSASNCHNVYTYNTFSAGPNTEIKKLLLEMKTQLADLQKTVEALKGTKRTGKGESFEF